MGDGRRTGAGHSLSRAVRPARTSQVILALPILPDTRWKPRSEYAGAGSGVDANVRVGDDRWTPRDADMTPTLLALATTIAAPALKDKPPAGLQLVGEWVVASYLLGGKESPPGVHIKFAS